jgi:opacity protein-like surface antigen
MAPFFPGKNRELTMRMLIALVALASCCVAQAQATEVVEPAQQSEAVTQPQTNTAEKEQAATQPAATAEKDQPAKEHANAATEVKTASAEEEKPKKFRPPVGYKSREKDGETVYCKQQVVLGSRFAHETCYTVDQLKDQEANAASQRLDLSRGRACGGPCTAAQ